MKKLLFLGCNTDQVPYLTAAKKAGYFVVGTDMNKDAPGLALADVWYPVGYEDVPALIGVGKKEGFTASDKVFTAGSQFAYIGASGFAEAFGIPFIPTATVLTCLDKTALYPLFEKYGLAVPSWRLYGGEASLEVALSEYGTVFLKSDFGKSPNYCFRVTKEGERPRMPASHDRYWRSAFVVQKEIPGTHYRLNQVGNTLYAFHKETDKIGRPAPSFSLGDLQENVTRMLGDLGLEKHLVKFDVIEADGTLYFIDIGLEPPFRLNKYLSHLGYDFPRMYFEHMVEGVMRYPDPQSLREDVTIQNNDVIDDV